MLTKSLDLLEYRVCCRRPDKRVRSAVVVTDELLDPGDECFHAPEGPATDRSLGDDVEPDFYLIEP